MYFYVRGCDYHQTTGGFERIEKVKEVFAFRRFPFEIPLVLEDSNFSAIKERNIVRKFFGKKETSLDLHLRGSKVINQICRALLLLNENCRA